MGEERWKWGHFHSTGVRLVSRDHATVQMAGWGGGWNTGVSQHLVPGLGPRVKCAPVQCSLSPEP